MNRTLLGWMIATLLCTTLLCTTLLCTTLRADEPQSSYIANFTANPPTIDGLATTETEWSDAEASSAGWVLLHSNNGANDRLDATNNRFDAVWDESGIYLRHQVDYGAWPQRVFSPEWDPGLDSLLLFFDPNTDGESNGQTDPNDDGVDAYQIAFNQILGQTEFGQDVRDFAIKEEVHVNGPFNIDGSHKGFSGLRIKQTTDSVDQFGYTEIFIPWEDFDARDPEIFDPQTNDVGLYHPFQPADGEEWFFNIARIETNGALPAWVAAPGSTFFSSRPHGVLHFRGGTTSHGDLNGDGVCDAQDIDLLAEAVRAGNMDLKFDLNVDGFVDASDQDTLVQDLHNTYYGDSNLDREFNSGDLVAVFRAGEYEDGIPGNSGWASGDWNGDKDFDSSDIVKAFRGGGYERGPRLAIVPEPSALILFGLGLLTLLSRTHRRSR